MITYFHSELCEILFGLLHNLPQTKNGALWVVHRIISAAAQITDVTLGLYVLTLELRTKLREVHGVLDQQSEVLGILQQAPLGKRQDVLLHGTPCTNFTHVQRCVL